MNRSFEDVFVKQCAPTLAGVKPANLFRFQPEHEINTHESVSYWNQKLSRKGIRVRLLKECKKTNSYLIMVYRRDWLSNIFSQKETQVFLKQNGYVLSDLCDSLLEQLSSRLCMDQEFPHEIGIFLGYPLCDVIGFIQNKGKNYSYNGCWKAYGDPTVAKEYSSAMKECAALYKQKYENGIPIDQLTVSAFEDESVPCVNLQSNQMD